MTINLDDRVRITLHRRGAEHLNKHWQRPSVIVDGVASAYDSQRVYKHGDVIEMQWWVAFNVFGPVLDCPTADSAIHPIVEVIEVK